MSARNWMKVRLIKDSTSEARFPLYKIRDVYYMDK
jgi:hypothetical protein